MTNNLAEYIVGRKKYSRPQGMLWANNSGTLATDESDLTYYVPVGYEVGTDMTGIDEDPSFIILSDDNRGPIEFTQSRIETRVRTVNGRMRSYHIADKLRIEISWEMLPSRSYKGSPEFDPATGKVTNPAMAADYMFKFTTDGGAGGAEILDWYESNTGSFWVYLAYDKYNNFEGAGDKFGAQNLKKYAQVVEMFISDFSYSVQKRSGSSHDLWNVSVSLEEA
jgi:hypothetical protein